MEFRKRQGPRGRLSVSGKSVPEKSGETDPVKEPEKKKKTEGEI